MELGEWKKQRYECANCLTESECHLPPALSSGSYSTWCFMSDPATLAFKSRLSGVLCQRLSGNPDKLCCVPGNCQPHILHLHSAWQFYLSWIFLPSSSDLPLPPWPSYQSEEGRPCHFGCWTSSALNVPCLEYSTLGGSLSLPGEEILGVFISGGGLRPGELETRKSPRQINGTPGPWQHHVLRAPHSPEGEAGSTSLSSSSSPGRKQVALTALSLL